MNKGKYILVNVCRLVTALTFILSGFVKAIDPLGTQYKLQDYATALHLGGLVPDWLTLATSVGLSAIEFTLGLLCSLPSTAASPRGWRFASWC